MPDKALEVRLCLWWCLWWCLGVCGGVCGGVWVLVGVFAKAASGTSYKGPVFEARVSTSVHVCDLFMFAHLCNSIPVYPRK